MMDHALIIDTAIHTFDQAHFICGVDPVSVYCQEYNPLSFWYKRAASTIYIFEMEAYFLTVDPNYQIYRE